METDSNRRPLLSIVLPTRNHIPYAKSAIDSILEIADWRLELVVQDNSDVRDLESYMRGWASDQRLRYQYIPPPLSMIGNFNAAVARAEGEYVCVIGDDDGVNPEIVDAAAWAKANDLDALTPTCIVNYLWEGGLSSTLFTRIEGGELYIAAFTGNYRQVDPKKEAVKLLRNGALYYHAFYLPRLYHGLVRRRCLEDIRERAGAYFAGLSPDIFSAVAISEIARRVVFIDYPLTIPGVCPGSGSTFQQKKGFGGRIEDSFLMRDRGDYKWCDLIPRVYTAETVWAESAIVAVRAMGREDLVRELNLPKLAAYCIGANASIAVPVVHKLFEALRRTGRSRTVGAVRFVWSLFSGPGWKLWLRIWKRLRMMLGVKMGYRISDVESIVEASHALSLHLKDAGRTFSSCVQR
jgi:glycosyltransferase involved in cell wall biosynthesis